MRVCVYERRVFSCVGTCVSMCCSSVLSRFISFLVVVVFVALIGL